MSVAGLLLTGGASRRLGAAKATLVLGGEQLVERSARVLEAACQPVLEVGPNFSRFDAVQEVPPGDGPLAAVAAGGAALTHRGHRGAVIVLAVDLPFVTAEIIGWLANHSSSDSVVPHVDGQAQSLCARYSAAAIETAGQLVVEGERSMRALLAAATIHLAYAEEWEPIASPAFFSDVDTPEDATFAGIRVPGNLGPRA